MCCLIGMLTRKNSKHNENPYIRKFLIRNFAVSTTKQRLKKTQEEWKNVRSLSQFGKAVDAMEIQVILLQ